MSYEELIKHQIQNGIGEEQQNNEKTNLYATKPPESVKLSQPTENTTWSLYDWVKTGTANWWKSTPTSKILEPEGKENQHILSTEENQATLNKAIEYGILKHKDVWEHKQAELAVTAKGHQLLLNEELNAAHETGTFVIAKIAEPIELSVGQLSMEKNTDDSTAIPRGIQTHSSILANSEQEGKKVVIAIETSQKKGTVFLYKDQFHENGDVNTNQDQYAKILQTPRVVSDELIINMPIKTKKLNESEQLPELKEIAKEKHNSPSLPYDGKGISYELIKKATATAEKETSNEELKLKEQKKPHHPTCKNKTLHDEVSS